MKRKQIEEEYNKLISESGTVDRYTCDTCGYMMHTTYKDKGVTPYTMRCPKCKGTMYHKQTFIKETVPDFVEVKNWYRPSLEELLKTDEGIIEHVLDGGLLLED